MDEKFYGGFVYNDALLHGSRCSDCVKFGSSLMNAFFVHVCILVAY